MRNGAIKTLLIAGVATIAVGVVTAREFAPRLIWNASASAPKGLYFPTDAPLTVGGYVLVEPSLTIQKLIDERRYLPPNTPLIKRVAAVSGAQICRENTAISIDGEIVAHVLDQDSKGRLMPAWRGCTTLKSDELFLLNEHQNSLDGRYFGVTDAANVIGVVQPVWVDGFEQAEIQPE